MGDPTPAETLPVTDLLAVLGDAAGDHSAAHAPTPDLDAIERIRAAVTRGTGLLSSATLDGLAGDDPASRAFRHAVAATTTLRQDGADDSLVPLVTAADAVGTPGTATDAVVRAADAVARLREALPTRAGGDVVPTLGATLAAALALGIDPGARRRALWMAACESPGAVRAERAADRAYLTARHAQNGVLFARYAAAGLTAPPAALEDRRGLARAIAAVTDTSPGVGESAVAAAWAELGRFAVETAWPANDGAHTAARMTAANALALAAAAIATEPMIAALETRGAVGRLARLRDAATRTGAAAHIMDFDDTHLETLIHAGAPIVGAVLHAAAEVDASGEELLAAVAVGVEVAFRVGRFMGRPHIDLGWHPTATMGAIGAAAGSARLLGLDPDAATRAISAAALTAAGLLAAAGTGSKALTAGRAAADGLEAALVAPLLPGVGEHFDLEAYQSALTGEPPRADAPADVLTDGLAHTWLLEENAYKPYACGILSHAVVDLGRALRELEPDRDRLGPLELHINPIVVRAMGALDPHDELTGKFSAAHCLAIGYLDGRAGIAQFESDRVTAPDARAVRALVTLAPDDGVPTDSAWARVSVGVERREVHVAHARGSLANPLTVDDIREKTADLLRMAAPARADDLADLLLDLGAVPSIRTLLATIGVQL